MTRRIYVPPTEGPLDGVEQALIRALVPVLVNIIRQQLIDEQASASATREPAEPEPPTKLAGER